MGKIIVEEIFGKIKCDCDKDKQCDKCAGVGWYLGRSKVKTCSGCGEILNETEYANFIEATNEDGVKVCDYDCKEYISEECTMAYILYGNECPFDEIKEIKRLKREIVKLRKKISKDKS